MCSYDPMVIRMIRLSVANIALIVALALNPHVSPTALADEEPTRRALLIGINKYASPEIMNLRGALNDIAMLRRILVTRFGFEETHVTSLTDADATRDGILRSIDRFVESIGPNDVVYIHYSGHGSRVEDASGDEDDGMDETIVPHNARLPGVPDITDDELDTRFARIRARTVLIVFDSCYSGTVTRSASSVVQPRFVAPDGRSELYRKQDVGTRQVVPVQNLPHVLMSSAPPDREALDGPIDEGFYGLFSYSLARSLDAQGPAASALAIHDGVKRELRRIQEQLFTTPPEPQLEGPPDRLERPVLQVEITSAEREPTPAASRRAWLAVRPTMNNQYELIDGAALNAQPGSQWGIYAPGETRFEYGNALALGTVNVVTDGNAILDLQLQRDTIPPGARAIALAPPGASEIIPVLITGLSSNRQSELMQSIRDLVPNVRFVGPTDFARFQVTLDSDIWRVMDAGGLHQVMSFGDTEDHSVATQLANLFARTSRAISLLALDNPAADFNLWVGVQTQYSSLRGLMLVTDDSAPSYRIRRDGEQRSHGNSLILELQSERDVYVTVASVDTEGRIVLLFPNSYQKPDYLPDGFVPANITIRIPDSLASGNAAGFHWDYSPPVGTDTIRVFAATDLNTANTMRRFISDADGDINSLRSLSRMLASTAVRGIRIVKDEAIPVDQTVAINSGQWAAASIVIQVRE